MKLNRLRKQIDGLDRKIIALLNSRARITVDIARLKLKAGKGVYSPDRERQVLRRAASLSKGPLPPASLEAIYREIMSSSLALERPLKVAYLGPEATFSHLAAMKRFGSQVQFIPCEGIPDVFLEVEKGRVDYGVVPIENSIEGAVSHTLDMFVDSDLKICAQVILDVSHYLLANCPMHKIQRVYSHPQVFGQCRHWLQEHLPAAEKVNMSSTTAAARAAVKDTRGACIASLLAADVYKLKVVARDIEDSSSNVTRFLVVGNSSPSPTGIDRTSVIFSIKDKVGALHDMLVPFKKYRINLTKIESRPSKKRAWDYYFFIDLEGHTQDARVRKALAALENQCRFLKVLGSYPVGE